MEVTDWGGSDQSRVDMQDFGRGNSVDPKSIQILAFLTYIDIVMYTQKYVLCVNVCVIITHKNPNNVIIFFFYFFLYQ